MADLPDGLSGDIDVGIRHSPNGVLSEDWYTTYQFASNEAEFVPGDVSALVSGIVILETELYFTPVKFHGGYGRRFVPKTIEPNPDPWVYNPTNHVPVPWAAEGQRTFAFDEVLYRDQVYDIVRAGDFGNPGRIEIRGGMSEDDVTQGIVSKVLVDPTSFASRIVDFFDGLYDLCTVVNCALVMIGQPRLSIERFVVDNVLRTIKEYGDPYAREVNAFTLGALRTDKGKARWHNNPS